MIFKQHPNLPVLFIDKLDNIKAAHKKDGYTIYWQDSIFNGTSALFERNCTYISALDNLSINKQLVYKELSKYSSPLYYQEVLTDYKKTYKLKEGDSLYFCESCTLPLSMLGDRLKIGGDDIVVIPMPERICYNPRALVFLCDDTLLILEHQPPIDITVDHTGQALVDYLGALPAEFDNYLDMLSRAVCIYDTPLIAYSHFNRFVIDVIDGKYKNIVTEHDVLRFVTDSFTQEKIDHLNEMAKSKDIESNELCMRILAMLDYMSYPDEARSILLNIQNNMFTITKPVQYMIDQLRRLGAFPKYWYENKEDDNT